MMMLPRKAVLMPAAVARGVASPKVQGQETISVVRPASKAKPGSLPEAYKVALTASANR